MSKAETKNVEKSALKAEISATEKEVDALKKQDEADKKAAALAEKRAEILRFADKDRIDHALLDFYMGEELVNFYIQRNPTEGKTATHEVMVNSMVFRFPKGVYFKAPLSVVEMLRGYYEIEANSGEEYRVDRSSDTLRALS